MLDLPRYLLRTYPRLQSAPIFLPRDNPSFGNPPFAEADGRVLIVRLSPFRDASASLAHLFLFREARRAFPKGFIDLSFFPPAADRRVFDREGVPYLFGLQSLRPADEFELLLVSNSCLLELVNLPLALLRSNLPLRSGERDDRHPLVILGGSNAAAAGAIVGADGESLVDGIFFGEGEEQAGPLLESFRESRGKDRRTRLAEAAAAIPAFWAAGGFPEKGVEKAVVKGDHEDRPYGISITNRANHREWARLGPAGDHEDRPYGPAGDHEDRPYGPAGDHEDRPYGSADDARELTRLPAVARSAKAGINANDPDSGLANELRIARISRIKPGLGPEAPPAYPVLNGEEAGTARLAISRGCPFSCSFCFESFDRRPYREVPGKEVLKSALELKRLSGARRLEAMSFTFNAHREIFELISGLNALFDRVGFKSQRIDLLASRPGLIEAELAAGKRSFTLGIEGVSERMRRFLNKPLPARAIADVLSELLGRRVREIKLFYLLTGHEGRKDLGEFREFAASLQSRRGGDGAATRVIFSFGYLVRMPFTPLQFDRLFLEAGEWKAIVAAVFSACAASGFEARLAMEWEDYCASQALALGGGALLEGLVGLARRGFCYDGTLSRGGWEALRGHLEREGIWNGPFREEKLSDYRFPLFPLHSAVANDRLHREYLRSKRMEEWEERPAPVGPAPGPGYREGLLRLMREKDRQPPVYFRARLGREFAGLVPEAAEALILRAIFAARPALAKTVFSAREALFSAPELEGRFAGVWGETVIGIRASAMDDMDGMDDMDAGSLKLTGRAQDFKPGKFRRADVAVGVGAGDGGERRRFEEHLKKCRIAFHLVREEGGYRLEVAEKSRKNLLYEGRFREGKGFAADLACGTRFDLAGLLSALIGGGHPGAVGAEVRTLEW